MSMMQFPKDQLIQLFSGQLAFDAQRTLIADLSQQMRSEQVLFQLAQLARQYENRVTGLPDNSIDIVGTGGDGANTLNFSTLAALLVAATGQPVAKHGNRATTSQCGSFDLLTQFSIDIPKTPEQAQQIMLAQGRVFLFAPYFHPAFKHVVEVRKWFAAQKQKTIFNVLGPLLNPAHVKYMLVGVYDLALLLPYAKALQMLGVQYAYVVYGNGLDEASLTGQTHYVQINQDHLAQGVWQPEDFGLARCTLADIRGGEPAQNFAESEAILSGQLKGPKRDMVVLNAALALQVAARFSGEISLYIEQINAVLASGQVAQLLNI